MEHAADRARLRLRPRVRPLRLLLIALAAFCVNADTVKSSDDTTPRNDVNVNTNDNVISEPEAPLQCPTHCKPGANATLAFLIGRRHVYSYTATLTATIYNGADDNYSPELQLTAKVSIDALSKCQMRLQILSARLENRYAVEEQWSRAQQSDVLAEQLVHRPLLFAYEDGRVGALCPAAGEQPWALNVKRGLLSALQSSGRSMSKDRDTVLEHDVSGLCVSEYERRYMTSDEETETDVLIRNKDFSTCSHHSRVTLPLPAGATPPAEGATSPISGSSTCSQYYVNGLLMKAECSERQAVRPFSQPSQPLPPNMAFAVTKQYLRFLKTDDLPVDNHDSAAASSGPRTSLQFNPEEEEDEQEDAEDGALEAQEAAQRLLERLAAPAAAPAAARVDAPALVRRLAAALRRADFLALERLFRKTADAPVRRRLLLEALPGARTQAAATLLAHLGATGALPADAVDAWLAARALHRAPSAEELAAFATLVGEGASAARLLAAGALVHSHCAAAPRAACARGRGAAADVVARLERALGPRCRPRAGDERRAQGLLRALGNAGVLSARGADTLRSCYEDASNPLAVRLAAVDALRRVPCDAADRRPLRRLFAMSRVDPELRIAAYLGAMRCPSAETLKVVRETLDREELGQVSSFVWSHLRNIQTSSQEWKTELSAFLEDNYLKEKFNTEATKYSRNYETSSYFSAIDTRASAEANVIFSPASLLPRSAAVNLTMEVFGQPVNLLELGARAEGFEKLMQDVFGPEGVYPEPTVRDLFAKLQGKKEAELENGLEQLSGAFSAAARLRSEPRAALYARVFGQEVAFASVGAPPGLLEAAQRGAPLRSALAALLQDGAVDYTKTFLLDDVKYTVPTCAGFPLSLSLGASGLLRVRASVGVNASADGAVQAQGELAPSATLGLDASLVLGTRHARVGVRLRQRARASYYAGASARLQAGRLTHVTLHAPTQQLQLLEADSELLRLMDDVEEPLPAPPLERVGACSGPRLERALGLRACANASFPKGLLSSWPPCPLSGPASLRLALDKTDAFDRYEMSLELETVEGALRGVKASFDAPGGRADRGVRAEVRLDPAGPAFHLQLRSPAGGVEASAVVSRNASAATADARLALGDAELLRVAASLRWEQQGGGALRLRLAELEARAAGVRRVRLAGELGVQPGARYHARVALRGSGEPVLLAGELLTQDGGYSVRGEVTCPLMNGSLTGNLTASPGVCASDLRLEYAAAGGERHTAAFQHSFASLPGVISFNASTEASQLPAATASLQWALRHKEALWEHRLRWEREGREWKAVQRLRTLRSGPATHLQALAAFSCPQRLIDYKLDLQHKVADGNYSTRAELLLGWRQRYLAHAQLLRAPGPRLKLNAEVSSPSVRATLIGQLLGRKHVQGNLDGELSLRGGVKHKLALRGSYEHEDSVGGPQMQMHKLRMELQGALNGQLRGSVALGADGVEHSLSVAAGAAAAGPPAYAHRLAYRMLDERHLLDGTVSLSGNDFSGSVEAVLTPFEQSTVVRLPFSSQIVISSKLLSSTPNGLDVGDLDAVLLEVSWDKHRYPNNYVSWNFTRNDTYSHHVLDYPNQHIFGEIINEPGYLSVLTAWAINHKIQSETRWMLDSNEGSISAWLTTPSTGPEKQKFSINYTASGEAFSVAANASCLGSSQRLAARGSSRADAVSAALSLEGDWAPGFSLALEHDPSTRTALSASCSAGLQTFLQVERHPDGRVAAVNASSSGDLLPLPACRLDYEDAAVARKGSLDCNDFLSLRFDASALRPRGSFSAWMPRLGNATFDVDAANATNTATFDMREPDGSRVLFVRLEHHQEAERNFSLELESQWMQNAVKTVISSQDDGRQTEYKGVITGDLRMSLSHTQFHSSKYPYHFWTEVVLPGGVRVNHTFQGQNSMNWENDLRVRTPAREGWLRTQQALNSSVFLHRWEAGAGARSAEMYLHVDRCRYHSLLPHAIDAQLRPPVGEPLAFTLRTGMSPRMRLSYPPHVLELSGHLELDRSGRVSAQLLIPDHPPMNATATYSLLGEDITANFSALWGNESLTADARIFSLPGKASLQSRVYHSPSGELLHFHVQLEESQRGRITSDALARFVGKEVRLRSLIDADLNAFLGEAALDLSTPFPGWVVVNASCTAEKDAAGASMWAVRFRKDDHTAALAGKALLDSERSLVNVSWASTFAALPNVSLVGAFDVRDAANLTLRLAGEVASQRALLEAAIVRRDRGNLARGGTVHALLITPLSGLEHSEVLLNFTNKENRTQELGLILKKDDWLLTVDGQSTFGKESSVAELNVHLPASSPVKVVTASLDYRRLSLADHVVATRVDCDGQVLQTNVSLAASDGELAAYLDMRSSKRDQGPLTARFNLAGELSRGKTMQFELAGNDGNFNLSGHLAAPSLLRLNATLHAVSSWPGVVWKALYTNVRYDLSGEGDAPRSAGLRVSFPDERQWISLSAVVEAPACWSMVNASLEVEAPHARRLRVGAYYDTRKNDTLRATAWAAAGDGQPRTLFDARLRLIAHGLTAQVVSRPLGLHALSAAAGWAPGAASRYARLHVLLRERELSAEANSTHDLLASEVRVRVSGAGGGLLHARYDFSSDRNVTALLVRGNDTVTLSASLVRTEGLHGVFYLELPHLGRVHSMAGLNTPDGSHVEILVDDENYDLLLHTKLTSRQKEIAVFAESQFNDLQKLNVSVQFDFVPSFNQVGVEMEYIADHTKLPFKVSTKIDKKMALFKLSQNIYDFLPENTQAKLTYEKLFEETRNPSYDFTLSVNNTDIFKSSANFTFDREREIVIDLKMNSHLRDTKWKIRVRGRCETKFPATVSLSVTDQKGALVQMDGGVVVAEQSGFTYRLTLNTDYGRQRREAEVEYYTENPLRMSVDTTATAGKYSRRYRAALLLDSGTLRLELLTPLRGYEHLTLNCRYDRESIILDARTSYPGFERVAVHSLFSVLEGPNKTASLYVERGSSSVGGTLNLEHYEKLLNISCELELQGVGKGNTGLNFWYDMRKDTKSAAVSFLGKSVQRVSGSIATNSALKLHIVAEIQGVRSSLNVSHDSKQSAVLAVLMGKKIADLMFKRDVTNVTTTVTANFRSHYAVHPSSFEYQHAKQTGEESIYITASVLGKTSQMNISATKSSLNDFKYSMEVALPQVDWKAEVNVQPSGMNGKASMYSGETQLLQVVLTSIRKHAEMHLSLMAGHSLNATMKYDTRGPEKVSYLHVTHNGALVIEAQVHYQRSRDAVELTAYAIAPKTRLPRINLNFTQSHDPLGQTSSLLRSQKTPMKHSIYVNWENTHKTVGIKLDTLFGAEKSLIASITNGLSETYDWTFRSYTSPQLSSQTSFMFKHNSNNREWMLSGVSAYDVNKLSEMAFEVLTPLNELERLGFKIQTTDVYTIKAIAIIRNKEAHMSATLTPTEDGTFARAEYNIPEHPRVEAALNITRGESPSVRLHVAFGDRAVSAEAVATSEDSGRVNAHARLSTPWTETLSLEGTHESGIATVRTLVGTRTIAEAQGKLIFTHDHDSVFDLGLEGTFGERRVVATAGWTYPMEGGSLERSIHLGWESEGTVVKLRFDMERTDAKNLNKRAYNGSLSISTDEFQVKAVANGMWPSSGRFAIRRGSSSDVYEASYGLETEDNTTKGDIILRLPSWEPLRVTTILERDIENKKQAITLKGHGYSVHVSTGGDLLFDVIFELYIPRGRFFVLNHFLFQDGYIGNISWKGGNEEKKIELVTDFSNKGVFNLRTPWNLNSNASWDFTTYANGQGLFEWNDLSISLESQQTAASSNARLATPWGIVRLIHTNETERDSLTLAVDDSSGMNRIFYTKLGRGMNMTAELHFHRDTLHKVEASVTRDLRHFAVLVQLPVLHLDTGMDSSVDAWRARFRSGGELAPGLNIRVESNATTFEAEANLPGALIMAYISFSEVQELNFAYLEQGLLVNLELRGGAAPRLHAVVESAAGAINFKVETESGSASLNAKYAAVAGAASAQWGRGRFSLKASAGNFSAGLTLGRNPMLLEVRVGSARLEVREGLAQLDAPDGTQHSLMWSLDRHKGSVNGSVRLESPAILPSAAELHMEFGPLDDGNGTRALVTLESGEHRHEVELLFRSHPRSALEVRVDCDGATLLALNTSLSVVDKQVDAALHLRLMDTENSIEVTHRQGFPVYSEIAASSPLLLAAERVSARLLVDARQLEAVASRGEGSARRYVQLKGSYRPERGSASLQFKSSSLSHVRDFGLSAGLHDSGLGFDASAWLLTSDKASIDIAVSAGYSEDALKANSRVTSHSAHGHRNYSTELRVPLRFLPETTLAAELILPDDAYAFRTQLLSTKTSLDATATVRAPGFDSKASLSARRLPSFRLALQLDSPVRGLEHYRLSLNEPVAHSAVLASYFEWDASRVELRHRFVLSEELIASEVQLTTPFEGHERYGMRVAYQNGEQKLALARVSYPGLEREIGFDLDYRVRGLLDASVRAAFHAPFLPSPRSASVAFTHVLDTQVARQYVLALAGEVNGRSAGANLSAQAGPPGSNEFRLDFTAQRNGVEAWLRLRSQPNRERNVYSVELVSPVPALRQLHLSLLYGAHRLHAVASHNDKLYVDLSMNYSRSSVDARFINPLKPVSLRLSIKDQVERADIGAELGWEKEGVLKTRLGMGIIGKRNTSLQRKEQTVFVITPGHNIRYKYITEESVLAWERAMEFSWNRKSTLGYALAVRRPRTGVSETMLRINLPARSFETNFNIIAGDKEVRQSANLLWDAARDPTKRLGYELRTSSSDGLTLTLLHPLLGDGARVNVCGRLRAQEERLVAAFDVALALLKDPGLDLRAGASFDLQRPLTGGGRATAALHLADRRTGCDARAQLDAALHGGRGAELALNVTYTPVDERGGALPRRTLLTELRAAPDYLLLRTRTPEAALMLRARYSALGAEVLAKVDDRDVLRAQVGLDGASAASASAVLQLGGGVRYTARASAPHRRLLSTEIVSSVAGQADNVGLRATLQLRTPSLLEARARWSGEAAAQAWPLAQREMERVPPAARAAADAHARLWLTRWEVTVPWPTRDLWVAHARAELDAAGADVRALVGDAAALCASAAGPATPYWRGVRAWAAAAAHAAVAWARAAVDALLHAALGACDAAGVDFALPALGDALAGFRTQALTARAAVLDRAVALLRACGDALEKAGAAVRRAAAAAHERLVEPAKGRLYEAGHAAQRTLFLMVYRIEELGYDISAGISNIEEFRVLRQLAMKAAIWFNEPFQEIVQRFLDTILEVIELVIDDLEESLQKLCDRVQQVAPPLSAVLRDIYKKVVWAWDNGGLNLVRQALLAYRSAKLEDREVVFNPRLGLARASVKLPGEWEGFDRAPRFDLRRLLQLSGDGDDFLDEDREQLLDAMNELTAHTPRSLLERAASRLLPAFSATGQLLGTSHVVTFDGNAQEVDGECSYLLAGDLAHNSFAVLVHFNAHNSSHAKRTFTILTPYHSVHVSDDYSVRVDGQATDLPAPDSPFLSLRRSEEALEVAAPGFRFRCHVGRHVCSVRVSAWHQGHVAGLLGSFDRERARDLAAPGAAAGPSDVDGARDARRAARAWRLGKCRASNRPPTAAPPRAADSPACRQMLESRASPLSACFARVDPAPYAALCALAGPCDAALAYREACALQTWLKLNVPAECESCRRPDGEWMAAGASAAATAAAAGGAAAADVALAVQRGCGAQLQRLPQGLAQLEAALRARGLRDVRFAVVAFGGAEEAPRAHTSGGRLWADARAAQKTLHRIVSSAEARAEAAEGAAEAAVAAAARLRPRAGAARAVLLLQCDACTRDAFPRVAAPLNEAGVPLHVLRPDVLAATPDAGAKASRALGVDARGLVLPLPRARRAAPAGLQVAGKSALTKDACTAAALERDGSVFDVARLSGAPPAAKRFLETWAGSVARSLRTQPCQRFRCAPGGVALCAEELSPQNSEEADEQFMQFLQ